MTDHRRAALPPKGHKRPEVLDGLVVTHVAEQGGKTQTYDFASLPVAPTLQLELATLFANNVRPASGNWRSIASSKQPFIVMLWFARWLSSLEHPPQQISEISRAVWNEWELSRPDNTSGIRQAAVLGRVLSATSALPLETAKAIRGRRRKEPTPKETSYSDDELREFRIDAHRVYRRGRDRIRKNLEHLRRYRAGELLPGTDDHTLGELLDHIAQFGEPPVTSYSRQRRVSRPHERVLGGNGKDNTWKRLFFDSAEATAVIVLLTLREGFNKTTVLQLEAPENTNPGGAFVIHRIRPTKMRRGRGRAESPRTYPDREPASTGRLLTHVLEVTQPARDLAHVQGRPAAGLVTFMTTRRQTDTQASDLIKDELTDTLMTPYWREVGYQINFRKLRKAVDNRVLRRPNMNTRDTHDRVYLLKDPQTAVDAEARIANGVGKALTHAEKVVAQILEKDTGDGQDTATLSCLDMLNSPFGEAGKYCGATFLLCLACPNAVVMPRHLGRLHYLHQCLIQLRGTLPARQWQNDYQPHFARLHVLRTEHYTEAQWTDALDRLTEEERRNIDYLLRGDLDS